MSALRLAAAVAGVGILVLALLVAMAGMAKVEGWRTTLLIWCFAAAATAVITAAAWATVWGLGWGS